MKIIKGQKRIRNKAMKLTNKQREELRNKYNGRCAYCGCELPEVFHADHIIPIRRNSGGTCENPQADIFENLNPSCPSCNKMKHTLSIEGFRTMTNPKYNIGQSVYHVTTESDKGVVLDCIYSLRKNQWEYLVTFRANEQSLIYYEEELSENKIYE